MDTNPPCKPQGQLISKSKLLLKTAPPESTTTSPSVLQPPTWVYMGFKIKPANESTTTNIRGLTYSVPSTIQTITIDPIPKSKDATASITTPPDTDPHTDGHQANLVNGTNTFTVRVTSTPPETGTQDHTITITRADGTTTWDPRLNIDLNFRNEEPWGIWSDGTTMWVNDYNSALLYAYRLNTGAYDHIRSVFAQQRVSTPHYVIYPTALWSDSQYFWLIARLSWGYPTDPIVTPKINQLSLSQTSPTEVVEHVDQRLDSQLNEATGIWSDGTTLWIADEEDHKLYALTLDTLALNSSKDIPLYTSDTDPTQNNEDPTGIWSDHQTMWVADQEDKKLYAYAMVDDPDTETTETFGSRTPAKDLPLESVNNEPRGIWGNPGYIRVANDGCPNTLTDSRFDACSTGNTGTDTIYAYTVPTSARTDIKVTIDSDDPITLTPENDSHTQAIVSSATSVTIVTEPLDVRASVSILNPDTDSTTPGIQLPPPSSQDPTLVTIVVIAQDEKTTHTYRIHLHRNPSTPTLIDPPQPAYQTLQLTWTPPTDLGTSPITHYEIRYILETADETVEANWSNTIATIPSEIQPLTYALTGLTNGRSYDLQVRAVTEVGYSPWSPTVTATPSGKPTFDNPTAFAATVPENSPPETIVGNPIPATDPDGDAITYSLSGTGADNFLIDNNGEITTSHTAKLDYETTPSYTITIEIRDNRKELGTDTDARAVDNTKQATITVTNLQEPGSITLNTNYPQVGSSLTATLTDPDDNIHNTTWAWSIYDTTQNQPTTIENQTGPTYIPTVSDAGKYLSVSVSYDDSAGLDQHASATPDYPVLSANAALQFTKENYDFPLLENLPVKYSIGQVGAGPGQVTYAITTQPTGNHFTIDQSGVIKTTKVWDYETPTDRGPHSLTITATRTTDSTTETTQVSIELANQLEQNEKLTLPDDIPGIAWTMIPNTTFIMAKEGTTRKPQYELNIQTKCRNNYYTGRNNYSSWLKVWQDGTAINYPKHLPSENSPFPGTDNPLLQEDLWLSHDLNNPRPDGVARPGSTCHTDYTDLWNDATTLYAIDAANRLIKAHDLTQDGLVITRNRAKDIPVTDDHYRTFWRIRGIWADTDTIWATASETGLNEGHKAAAYSRSTYIRDTSKDYSATPPLTISQDYSPSRRQYYLPADKWRGGDNLWFLDISFRLATGAFDPAHTAPTTLKTCTATDSTTRELQMAWTKYQANTPLRLTGLDGTTKRLYILSNDTQDIITYDTSKCLPELINSEYNYQLIPNKPHRPHYPAYPQAPTGISTHKDTPQMYFSFSTGEILYISKILPLIDTNTINLPEHTPPSIPVGPRFDPTTTNINQGPYTWEMSGTDEASFVFFTSGDDSQYLQILTKPGVTYDYETKSSYSLTLTVTDADEDTTTATVTVQLINLNDQATGDVSISGDAHVGKTFTAVHEDVADPDGLTQNSTPTYQWLRNGIPISESTAQTHALQLADYNNFITVRITYTDDADFKNHFTPPAQRITYIPVTASLSQSQVILQEGDTTLITLDLSEAPHRQVTIDLALTPGSNLETDDYTVSPTEITFEATDTAKTITLAATDDFVDEDNEELTIRIVNLPTQVIPGGTDHTDLTITDDDTAGVSLTNTTLTIQEGTTTDYFMSLDSEPTHDVTVTLSLPADPELTLSKTTLTFTDQTWNSHQDITVTTSHDDDALHEPDRQITHAVTSQDPKYNSINVDQITVSVTDDDTAGVTLSTDSLTILEGNSKPYTIVLDTEPSNDVTITINDPSNTDITADPDSYTFTPDDWGAPNTITVTTVDDDDAPDDSGTITHTITTTATEYLTDIPNGHPYPAVTVRDLDVTVTDPDEPEIILSKTSATLEEGTTATYTVHLDTQPINQVTITITGHANTPVSLDETSLTFSTTNWRTKQTVTITAADDRNAVVPETVTLSHDASGGDYGLEEKDLTISITETDEEGVTIAPTSMELTENGYKTYTIVLTSQPLVDVDININIPSSGELKTNQTILDDKGTPEDTDDQLVDKAISSVTFTEDNWDTAQTVKVTALDDEDAVDEPDVDISHVTDTTDILYKDLDNLDDVTVEVTDDEPEVSVTFSAATYTTTEGSAAATVTVTLSEDPNRPVPIAVTPTPTTNTGTQPPTTASRQTPSPSRRATPPKPSL